MLNITKESPSPVSNSKNAVKEVSFDINIPRSEMAWLDCSAVGQLTSECCLNTLHQIFFENGVNCQTSFMGGVFVLITFNNKEPMENFVTNHKNICKDVFTNVSPWVHSSHQKFVPIWVTLEEVPLSVWNEKFFRSLGDSWGTFVMLAKRLRVDQAKFLVIMESRLKIPTSVAVNIRGLTYRIIISTEDSNPTEGRWWCNEPENDKSSNGFFDSQPNKEVDTTAVRDSFKIKRDSSLEDFEAMFNHDRAEISLKISSVVFEKEQKGGYLHLAALDPNCPSQRASDNDGDSCGSPPFPIITSLMHVDPTLHHNSYGKLLPLTAGLEPALLCMDMGQSNTDFNIADEPVTRYGSGDSESSSEDGKPLRVVKSLRSKKKCTAKKPKRKKTASATKRRRKLRKEIREILYGEQDTKLDSLDNSVSDSDIMFRNEIIRKEAEATWEVCSALGVAFDKSKEQMVDIFSKLEEKDRCKKASAV